MASSAAPDVSTLVWSACWVCLAWLVAGACAAFAWRRRRSLERLTPPEREQLLAELVSGGENPQLLDDVERRLAVAELNQRLADVSFELDVLPATYAALMRISLASGSALAVAGFLSSADLAPLVRALRFGLAALAGLSGAGLVAAIGRAAKQRSRQIKERWDSSSRDIGKALGASLEGPAGIRGNSFPG
ncbi:MAG TPA: hypothetical protein VNW92_23465 [Polyangiaceae bacterium]|nr:hypothetical protein [Polyangiaceae bacterium]